MHNSLLRYPLYILLLLGFLSACSIHQSGKYGYIDKTGQFVVQPKFDAGREFSEGLAPVGFAMDKDIIKAKLAASQANPSLGVVSFYRWGYIDKTGKLVIAATFDQAHPFHYGRACVCIGTKIGYIDHTGKFIVPPQYEDNSSWGIGGDPEEVCDYHEGLAVICVGGDSTGGRIINPKAGYIDLQGNVVIQPVFQAASSFSETLAVVAPWTDETLASQQNSITLPDKKRINIINNSSHTSYGYIDHQGNFQIKPQFASARPFSCGLAQVQIGERRKPTSAYIDKTGKVIIGPNNKWMCSDFKEELAAITIEEGFDHKKWKTGFIDKTGKFVMQPKQYIYGEFHDGMAIVCEEPSGLALPKWGFINHSGQTVVPIQYDGTEWYDFSDGLAAVPGGWFRPDGWLNKSWGFIDKTGKTVIQPRYELPNIFSEKGAGAFHEGLAAVKY